MACLRSSLRCCFVTLPIFAWDGVRLFLYTVVLAPAFVRFAWYYWVAADRTVVTYNTESVRQTLDIYRPAVPKGNTSNVDNNNGNVDDAAIQERSLLCENDPNHHAPPQRNDSSDDGDTFIRLQGPVVFFCCGGAWMIGYKMWGALLARILTAAGLTVVVPDYRNYPFWGNVPCQVADVETALQWTLDHTASTTTCCNCNNNNNNNSGDQNNVVAENEGNAETDRQRQRKRNVIVVGQSAGGHLLLTLLLRKAMQQMQRREQQQQQQPPTADPAARSVGDLRRRRPQQQHTSPFEATDLSGILTLSAPLNLNAMQDTFRKHGLDEHLVDRMFGGVKDDYDPFVILQRATDYCAAHHQQPQEDQARDNVDDSAALSSPAPAAARGQFCDFLPPIKIYHGSRDRTVPPRGSEEFTEQLQAHNVAATFHMYDGWSHTDPILEGPMDADHRFHCDIFDAVLEWTNHTNTNIDNNHTATEHLQWPGLDLHDRTDRRRQQPRVMRRLCPHVLVQLGRFFMPF